MPGSSSKSPAPSSDKTSASDSEVSAPSEPESYSKAEIDARLAQILAAFQQQDSSSSSAAAPKPGVIEKFRTRLAAEATTLIAAHRRSSQVFTAAWKAKSEAQHRVHEYETACAYAVTVLQNDIVFQGVAAFEQLAIAGLASVDAAVDARILREMAQDLQKTIVKQRDFNDSQRVLHRTIMMYPETPAPEMKAAVQQAFAQACELDAKATLQKTCQEFTTRRQKLEDQMRSRLPPEVTVSVQNSPAGSTATSPATPVLTKVHGGGAGGSGGPGTGGKGKGGAKGTTMITGAKRSAAAAGLGPDLAAATGGGADAAASAAPFSVDLDAAAGVSPSL